MDTETSNFQPDSQPKSQEPTKPDSWERLIHDVPFAGEKSQTPESPETSRITPIELPTTSPNSTCRSILRYIKFGKHMDDVKAFVESSQAKSYDEFPSVKNFIESNPDYVDGLKKSLTLEKQSALKRYTGFDYKLINQVARGHWDYDTLGRETPEKVASANHAIEQIEEAISTAPTPTTDFITYRGTNLDTFNGYNVNNLSDLKNLNHQFFLETGFTSTSLNPDTSFNNRNFDDPLRKACNIEIKYLIPKGYPSGICLAFNGLSWNPEQNEFLLNHYSLSYISDVKVDTTNNHASLEMTLIPSIIYDHPPEKQ